MDFVKEKSRLKLIGIDGFGAMDVNKLFFNGGFHE
jgi:hypothetical protein